MTDKEAADFLKKSTLWISVPRKNTKTVTQMLYLEAMAKAISALEEKAKAIGPNQWMEKEPSTTTFELYTDDDFSGGGYLLCTKCNMKFSFGAYHILEYDNFCPHCGRRVIRQADPNTVVFTFERVKEGDGND